MEDRKKGKKMGWFRSNIKEFIKDKVQNLECTPCSYSVDTGQPLLLATRIMEAYVLTGGSFVKDSSSSLCQNDTSWARARGFV